MNNLYEGFSTILHSQFNYHTLPVTLFKGGVGGEYMLNGGFSSIQTKKDRNYLCSRLKKFAIEVKQVYFFTDGGSLLYMTKFFLFI